MTPQTGIATTPVAPAPKTARSRGRIVITTLWTHLPRGTTPGRPPFRWRKTASPTPVRHGGPAGWVGPPTVPTVIDTRRPRRSGVADTFHDKESR